MRPASRIWTPISLNPRRPACSRHVTYPRARRGPLPALCSSDLLVVTVREATPADLDALEAIEDASRPGGNWKREHMEAEIHRDRATVLVAENHEWVVGVAVAWAVPPDELHVLEVAVLPQHRRQGIGRQLMQHLVDMHRGRVQTVMLEVRESNKGAQRLYRKLGFLDVGVRPKYYENNGEDAILMNLSVDESI